MKSKNLLAAMAGLVAIGIGVVLRVYVLPENDPRGVFVEMTAGMMAVLVSLFISRYHAPHEEDADGKSINAQIAALEEKISFLRSENAQLMKTLAGDAMPQGNSDMQASSLILRQRAFLHDVASPTSIAQGMIELALRQMAKDPQNPELAKVKLNKALKAVEVIAKQIQENREYLILSAS